MTKFYFKVIFQDNNFGYEYFRATNELDAITKMRSLYPDMKELVRLEEDGYEKELKKIKKGA